jgi:hypothetical protein
MSDIEARVDAIPSYVCAPPLPALLQFRDVLSQIRFRKYFFILDPDPNIFSCRLLHKKRVEKWFPGASFGILIDIRTFEKRIMKKILSIIIPKNFPDPRSKKRDL